MSFETKKALSIAAFVVAAFIAVASLYIDPMGAIDPSALWAIVQFLIMACTLLGIDATLLKYTKDQCDKSPK